MATDLKARISAPLIAFREVLGNANLRRLMLAWSGFFTADWAYLVAISLYAYRVGGALAVGVVALVQTIPAAGAAPFAALLADRYPRNRVYLVANMARAVTLLLLAAAVVVDAPVVVVYAVVAMNAVVSTVFWPAQTALLPTLARTPEELTASNAASSSIESLGTMIGPSLGGLVAAAAGVEVVFLVGAAIFILAAYFTSRIRVERDAPHAGESAAGILHESLAGFRTLRRERDVRLVVGLFGVEWLARGALEVLIVVTALELLGLGQQGVGFLNSALGFGALVGAIGALGLVGARRLALPLGVAVVVWGIPIALIPLWSSKGAALVLLAVVGIANSVADVAGFTLLQRTVPDEVLARVFGVLEGLAWLTYGLGAIGVPVLISALGLRGALVACGSILPAIVALVWRRLSAIDRSAVVPVEQIRLLRSIELFSPLGAPAIEHLASNLIPMEFELGSDVVRQGEVGDRFYVVVEGEVEVSADGRFVATLGPGEHFGEIALLKDVPRTATVTALSHVRLYALERDEFLGAVTGHAQSAETADAVVGARLRGLAARRT